MRRVEWLKWAVHYGNPKTRVRRICGFLAFELYRLGCLVSGYRVTHWLDKRPPRLAGKYLRVTRPCPLTVTLLDQVFAFGEEAHSEYVPYTPEAAQELRRAGRGVTVVEISYRLCAVGNE